MHTLVILLNGMIETAMVEVTIQKELLQTSVQMNLELQWGLVQVAIDGVVQIPMVMVGHI